MVNIAETNPLDSLVPLKTATKQNNHSHTVTNLEKIKSSTNYKIYFDCSFNKGRPKGQHTSGADFLLYLMIFSVLFIVESREQYQGAFDEASKHTVGGWSGENLLRTMPTESMREVSSCARRGPPGGGRRRYAVAERRQDVELPFQQESGRKGSPAGLPLRL